MKLEGVILQEDNVTHRDVGLWSGLLLSGLQRLDIGSVPPLPQLFCFTSEQAPSDFPESIFGWWDVLCVCLDGSPNQEESRSDDLSTVCFFQRDG